MKNQTLPGGVSLLVLKLHTAPSEVTKPVLSQG